MNKKIILNIIVLISFFSLSFAYFVEFILNHQPCNLCKIQRIPYGLSMIIIIAYYSFRKDQIFYGVLLMLVFLFSIIISIYHFGIEQGFIAESAICISENTNLITKEEILNSLKKLTISCKDVAFKIFGLSLTTYNIFVSTLMLYLSIKIYLLSHDIKK